MATESAGELLKGCVAAMGADVDDCNWDAMESPSAEQKAFPNASSAHAAQLSGSPLQTGSLLSAREASGEGEESRIWKIGALRGCVSRALRRKGTAGWNAGRLSRMDGRDGERRPG